MKRHQTFFYSSDEISHAADPNATEPWDDTPEKPSKSQRKRDADALQKLGVSLMSLKSADLARCPLRPVTRDAILMCKTIHSRPALKRQRQLIGKLMRNEDAEAIQAFLSPAAGAQRPRAQHHSISRSHSALDSSDATASAPVSAGDTALVTAPAGATADATTCDSDPAKALILRRAIVIDPVIPPEANLRMTGQGPELLIMHGWTGAAEDFDPIVERLAPHATCIRWDARPYYSGQVTIEQLAADVETIIRTRCLTRPILLGHSMGALVAFEYLKNYSQELLSGLVIVDMTPCMITRPDWPLALYGQYSETDNQQFIDELEAAFIDRVCQLIVNGKKMTAEQQKAFQRMDFSRVREMRLNKLNPRAWIDCWQSFVGRDYREILTHISLPTLLLYGEKSNFYGPAVAEYMHESIDTSELVLFAGAGHSPQVEQPDLFAQELTCFINNC